MSKRRSINFNFWVSILLCLSLIFTQTLSVTAKGSIVHKEKKISISIDQNGNVKLKNAGTWRIKKVKSSNSKVLKFKKIKNSGKVAVVKKGKIGQVQLNFTLFNTKTNKIKRLKAKIKVRHKSVKIIQIVQTRAIEVTTIQPVEPSEKPTSKPTVRPSWRPIKPSWQPTEKPVQPTNQPSINPSWQPSSKPTIIPTIAPTVKPTVAPTVGPSAAPTATPAVQQTETPTIPPYYPSGNWVGNISRPTIQPSVSPSTKPSVQPSVSPSAKPSVQPSVSPSAKPSVQPSVSPSAKPSVQPSVSPSAKPSVQPSVSPSVKPEEPTECKHEWSNWSNIGENGETRSCNLCQKEETREHEIEEIVSYEQIENAEATTTHMHTKIITKQCKNCSYNTSTSIEEECIVEWQYSSETGNDVSVCVCGKELIREHIHSDAPSDLNYEFLSSNNDGTHVLQGKYTCDICQAEVILTKTEECVFGDPTIKWNPLMHNLDNIHLLVYECTVCAYQKEEQQSCEPNGETYYFRYLSQIYTAQTCTICNNRCLQKPHFDHILGEWQYYDKSSHRRECPCTDVREEEPHRWSDYDSILGGFTCEICHHVELVKPHNHGYGMANKWGDKNLMIDIVMNQDAYSELQNMSPINNPHPDPNDYCYRFDFLCFECGLGYSAYVAHEFVDGFCTSSRCGNIAQNPEL